jgi:hypothetical protein
VSIDNTTHYLEKPKLHSSLYYTSLLSTISHVSHPLKPHPAIYEEWRKPHMAPLDPGLIPDFPPFTVMEFRGVVRIRPLL